MRLFHVLLFLFALTDSAFATPLTAPLLSSEAHTTTMHPPIVLASEELEDDPPPIPTVDLVTPPEDLWQRMRNGFAMPDLDSPLVASQQAWYLNSPQYLHRVFERAQRYLYYIVGELEKRGMPTELALLPIIESAYNPQARSPARALGIWQFIPSTGKNYNLKQTPWVDERRDIVASTQAALDYLQYIYEMHGDWQLALASYNWGEGAVARAIAKNLAKGLPTDYTSLTMPAETRNYVPKLQAVKNIIANPQLFGVDLMPIPNQPYFSVVEREGNMDIALAARLADIPLTEFLALNPACNRPVMPDSINSPLVLPADKVEAFFDNLENHTAQDKPLSAWKTYRLGDKETLASVAKRHGLTVARLMQLNGLGRKTKTHPGMALLVPGKGAILSDSLAKQLPQAEPEGNAKKVRQPAKKRTKVAVKSTRKPAKAPVKRKHASK